MHKWYHRANTKIKQVMQLWKKISCSGLHGQRWIFVQKKILINATDRTDSFINVIFENPSTFIVSAGIDKRKCRKYHRYVDLFKSWYVQDARCFHENLTAMKDHNHGKFISGWSNISHKENFEYSAFRKRQKENKATISRGSWRCIIFTERK